MKNDRKTEIVSIATLLALAGCAWGFIIVFGVSFKDENNSIGPVIGLYAGGTIPLIVALVYFVANRFQGPKE